MKQFIKYTDFILLRLIPTSIFLYSSCGYALFALQKRISFFSLSFLRDLSFIMCFVFLGFASVLRIFNVTRKFSAVSRYGACAMALIYIVLYVFQAIEKVRFLQSLQYTPSFSDYYSLFKIQSTMYTIAFLLVIINCILKDKFFRTKWLLTVLCALSLFIAVFCSPLYTLIKYDDTITFRFLLNSFLISYCYCAVIITGLFPSKTEFPSEVVINAEI